MTGNIIYPRGAIQDISLYQKTNYIIVIAHDFTTCEQAKIVVRHGTPNGTFLFQRSISTEADNFSFTAATSTALGTLNVDILPADTQDLPFAEKYYYSVTIVGRSQGTAAVADIDVELVVCGGELNVLGSPHSSVSNDSLMPDLIDLTGAFGGASATDQWLLANFVSALNNPNGIPTYGGVSGATVETLNVIWPDSSTGLYTATTIDATWEEATDWEITHDDSGRKVVATGLVRNGSGLITTNYSVSITDI